MAPLAPPLTRPLVLSKAKHCQAVLSKATHWHAVMSEVPFKTSTPFKLLQFPWKNRKKIKQKDREIASTKVRTFVSGRIMRPPSDGGLKSISRMYISMSFFRIFHLVYTSLFSGLDNK